MRAEREKVTRLLKTARGQIDGVLKMIEEDRYCIDISTQLMAVQAILRKVNVEILNSHINCCVKEALEKGDAEKKVEEIMSIVDKLSK